MLHLGLCLVHGISAHHQQPVDLQEAAASSAQQMRQDISLVHCLSSNTCYDECSQQVTHLKFPICIIRNQTQNVEITERMHC